MIAEGDLLPDATLTVLADDGVQNLSVRKWFAGRRIVLFAVPGAFTPTCSARHLPGFVAEADAFGAKGFDLACLSVNDAFVMDAWGKANGAGGKVAMLADGNGDFTRAVGLDVDARARGMGWRSRRYAMIVDDGRVVRLFVEAAGAFEVSAADYVLAHLPD